MELWFIKLARYSNSFTIFQNEICWWAIILRWSLYYGCKPCCDSKKRFFPKEVPVEAPALANVKKGRKKAKHPPLA
jgi:hypothetical protein